MALKRMGIVNKHKTTASGSLQLEWVELAEMLTRCGIDKVSDQRYWNKVMIVIWSYSNNEMNC